MNDLNNWMKVSYRKIPVLYRHSGKEVCYARDRKSTLWIRLMLTAFIVLFPWLLATIESRTLSPTLTHYFTMCIWVIFAQSEIVSQMHKVQKWLVLRVDSLFHFVHLSHFCTLWFNDSKAQCAKVSQSRTISVHTSKFVVMISSIVFQLEFWFWSKVQQILTFKISLEKASRLFTVWIKNLRIISLKVS